MPYHTIPYHTIRYYSIPTKLSYVPYCFILPFVASTHLKEMFVVTRFKKAGSGFAALEPALCALLITKPYKLGVYSGTPDV